MTRLVASAAAAAVPWLLILLTSLSSSTAANTLFSNQSITDGDTLISPNQTFEFGFFSLANSSNRYLGIWFRNIPVRTIVWIANRDSPIPPGGILKLQPDGDLVLLSSGKNSSTVWSTGITYVSNPVLELLDNGNLLLRQGNGSGSSTVIPWQSFDHPTDALLPGMKLGMDMATGVDRYLTSWTSASDPSTGNFTLKIDSRGSREVLLWDTSTRRLMQRVDLASNGVFNFSFVSDQDETYLTYSLKNQSATNAMLVLTPSGDIRRNVWIEQRSAWLTLEDLCDTYPCGPNGVCSTDASPVCSCIQDFLPRSPIYWGDEDFSDGCVRRSWPGGCEGGRRSVIMPSMVLPSTANAVTSFIMTLEKCHESCISNCSCTGFASAVASEGGGSGCIMWFGDLIHMKKSDNGGQDLFVIIEDASSQGYHTERTKSWVIAIGLIGLLTAIGVIVSLASVISVIFFRTILKRKEKKRGVANIRDHLEAKGKNIELPLYKLSAISTATENFFPDNKLGEGGFGPVYKGMLFDVQVAVKRLSRSSAQGLEEFKSEIQLLAKLQHTNLVKILGCCIEAEEKIVVYEYMKNGSLDRHLFDPQKGAMLDWHKRVHIIEGITQGLLYLHKYSRLRVIHRDLKASNILLDADMNPKISDFGMARIFSPDKSQVNTSRVVGTYGYMSPEYVMEGLFSVKSDVFSFGVLLLEILSGKRNVSHHNHGSPQNLLGYAWELLMQGKEVELMDTSLGEACPTQAIVRYVKVALLCVQDLAVDRPTIVDVSDMLNNQSMTLPTPKQPAFFIGRFLPSRDANLEMQLPCSNNCVTLSLIDGR